MVPSERRKAERKPTNHPGRLFLSGGRSIPVRILNLGPLGALVSMTDLEEAVLEGERAVLEHPAGAAEENGEDGEAGPSDASARSTCAIVRVELDLAQEGVARHLAVFFDGGSLPAGYES